MKEADVNKDGKIDYAEFLKMMMAEKSEQFDNTGQQKKPSKVTRGIAADLNSWRVPNN